MAQWQILLMINVAMFIVGCFMESLAVMIMAVPVLLPLLAHAGVDLVHFGVFFVVNVMLSAITPPVGTIMYAVCGLNKVSIPAFAKGGVAFHHRPGHCVANHNLRPDPDPVAAQPVHPGIKRCEGDQGGRICYPTRNWYSYLPVDFRSDLRGPKRIYFGKIASGVNESLKAVAGSCPCP